MSTNIQKNQITEGIIWRQLLLFFFPILLGTFFQQLYNTIDSVIVGQFVGKEALAAVGGSSAQIVAFVVGFFTGLSSGASVTIAQFFGAKDSRSANKGLHTAYAIAAFGGLILTVSGIILTPFLLEMMNTPADIFDDTLTYMLVIYYGIWASVFYNMISSIIRALGDSITPLIFLVVASLLNIGLDFLFILNFGMGVAGAAWATVLSQAISGFLCLWYVARKFPILKLKRSDWKWNSAFAWEHLRVGLPMAFQFSITAIGCIILQAVLNLFGSTVVAGFTAGSKIDLLAVQAIAAIGMTMATYAAQNFGAGKIARIRTGVNKSTLLCVVFSALACVFVILFGRPMTALFVGAGEKEVIDASQTYLVLNGIFYLVLGLLFIFRNTLQGMGFALIPLLGGVSELLLRVVAAFVFARYFGYPGVCLASPAAWIGATVILIVTYAIVMRRYARLHYRYRPDGHPAFSYMGGR